MAWNDSVRAVALGAAGLLACESAATSPDLTEPDADAGPIVDAAPTADAAPGCVAPTGEGTPHNLQALETDDEVWTAAGSPHVVGFSLTIRAGQRLTIEPCAVVRLKRGVDLRVSGELVAEGEPGRPILLERDAEAAWGRLHVEDVGQARLAFTRLVGGGYLGNGQPDRTAAFVLDGDPRSPAGVQALARVDNLTIEGSESLGALLVENGAFSDDSRDLTITGSASAPMRLWQRAVSRVPTGTYTGNERDELLIDGGDFGDYEIVGDATLRDRGVPYHVTYAHLRVGSATQAGALTIEPGVTLRFDRNLALQVWAPTTSEAATGALRAVGTAAKPIVFTSAAATPSAGDWTGLLFRGTPSPNNRIEHATVAYAGGSSSYSSYDCVAPGETTSGDDAAIVIATSAAGPAVAFVAHTRIEHSAKFGVVRGWRGDPVDFMPTNELVGVASCWQTYPRGADVNGSCPPDPPCPR